MIFSYLWSFLRAFCSVPGCIEWEQYDSSDHRPDHDQLVGIRYLVFGSIFLRRMGDPGRNTRQSSRYGEFRDVHLSGLARKLGVHDESDVFRRVKFGVPVVDSIPMDGPSVAKTGTSRNGRNLVVRIRFVRHPDPLQSVQRRLFHVLDQRVPGGMHRR